MATIVVTVALVAQILDQVARDTFSPENYFWFLSIQSSIANIVVLSIGGIVGLQSRRDAHGLAVARGALVAYAIMTATVYNLLLKDALENPAIADPILQWPLAVVHQWIPLYLALDWLLNPYRHTLRRWFIPVAMVYPAVWVGASLIRGSLTSWYPYAFLDPAEGEGMIGVLITLGLIGLFFVAVLAVVAVVNRIHHWIHTANTLDV